jgi:hypothetical protein
MAQDMTHKDIEILIHELLWKLGPINHLQFHRKINKLLSRISHLSYSELSIIFRNDAETWRG